MALASSPRFSHVVAGNEQTLSLPELQPLFWKQRKNSLLVELVAFALFGKATARLCSGLR